MKSVPLLAGIKTIPLVVISVTNEFPGMSIDYRVRSSQMVLIDAHREELAETLEALAKSLRQGSYPFVKAGN